ncbi:Vps54-like protein-domain-containing protein [Infundibulicybe gibba]|nr:Vps54-like protein-domain-containing protein [Infundibulicybe gibba]
MSDDSSSLSRPTTPTNHDESRDEVPDHLNTARPAYRFTWDASTRKAGPESVSGTTEGRGGGDYFNAPPPRLGLLNTSTTTLALGALPSEWSSAKHGFHAISTVLNSPHKRQAPPKAHSALPSVPPADLPRVRRKDFDAYLRAITPEWERFEHSARLGREGAAQLDATPRVSTESGPAPLRGLPTHGRAIPALDGVPAVYFDSTFDLGDPRMFARVTEQRPGEDADPAALAHALPLLEKLSHYADTVEQHLILEISLRSTSFFAALTNLNDLKAESSECLAQISELRRLLKEVDTGSAMSGLNIVRMEGKTRNLARVQQGVKLVAGVVEMTKVARGLVSAGQWGEALGVVEELQALWDGKPMEATTPGPEEHAGSALAQLDEVDEHEDDVNTSHGNAVISIPLSKLNAFAALPTHLRTLTMEITSSLSSELVSVLRMDLLDRIAEAPQGRGNHAAPNPSMIDVPPEDGAPDSNPMSASLSLNLHDRLRPLMHDLFRTKGVKEAILSWREIALAVVRGIIRTHLPSFTFDDDDYNKAPTNSNGIPDSKSSWLANHLRAIQHDEFLLLMNEIYKKQLNAIKGLKEQAKIVSDVLDRFAHGPQKSTLNTASKLDGEVDLPMLREDLTDILSSSAELANTQSARLVSLRGEQHAVLGLEQFLALFEATWAFVLACEVICGKMIVGLRGVVVGQAKAFLQNFHQARISQSAKLVEDEQWNATEITPALQHATNILVDSAVRDSAELVIKTQNDATPLGAEAGPPPSPQQPKSPLGVTRGSSSSKQLRIEDRAYYPVSATAEVLVLLLDYLRVIVNFPMLTTDTMSRVIEFLKSFNSRTCQVVLGAGALKSAGLKNITARHLALASQSLSIMFELIPYVRETFRRHLSPKQAVMLVEFDKLKRDYQEHQNEIHSKLIVIMGDRLNAHIKTLQGVDWNVPKPGGGVNNYMEILVKETVTLHKVLSRYLSTPVLEYVMTQVFAAINHRLSEEYGKIELPHQEAKNRLLADAKYLHQNLAALKNVGTPSGMLETVIAEKSLPRKNVPAATMAKAPAPSRSSTISSSANQRLKGLLSGRSGSLLEKALPTPTPAPEPEPPHSPTPRTASPAPMPTGGPNGHGVNGQSRSSLSLPQTASPGVAPTSAPSAGITEIRDPDPEPGPTDVNGSGLEGSPAPQKPSEPPLHSDRSSPHADGSSSSGDAGTLEAPVEGVGLLSVTEANEPVS